MTKNRNGKAIVNLSSHSHLLQPQFVHNLDTDLIAAIGNQGHLLVFPAKNLPIMPRGKGNKIINIPSAKFAKGEEAMIALVVLAATDSLTLYSGKRHVTLKPADLAYYHGERALRGNKLPRGFQKVDNAKVEK